MIVKLKPLMCRPAGARLSLHPFPGLTPWANSFRASGAGFLGLGNFRMRDEHTAPAHRSQG
jgi:hypothetical protein